MQKNDPWTSVGRDGSTTQVESPLKKWKSSEKDGWEHYSSRSHSRASSVDSQWSNWSSSEKDYYSDYKNGSLTHRFGNLTLKENAFQWNHRDQDKRKRDWTHSLQPSSNSWYWVNKRS